jgi:osmotically-inducible protein OsmY
LSCLLAETAQAEPGTPQPSAADAAIATEIEHRLSADRTINAQQVEIDVRGGVVILRGRVPSEDAKERAETLARAVTGVDEVRNHLTAGTGGREGEGAPGPIPDQMPGAR